MRSHTLEVLGLEVSFKAEADPRRIERARIFLEERYSKLAQYGGQLSKEKLLTFLALSLADDVLLQQAEKSERDNRLKALLVSMERVTE
jgi:cell division protein ZapA